MPAVFNYIFGNFWRHALFVFLISVVFAGIFTDWAIFTSWTYFALGTLWSSTIWLTQWFGNGYISDQVDKRISWMERPGLRLVVGVVGTTIYSALAILVVNGFFQWWLGGGIENFWAWALGTARIAVVIALIIAFIFTAVGFFSNWRKKEIEAEKLSKELITYKYEVLRNQINPHFLFNSFNVLSDLVYEDQDLAVKFIRQMSQVYRYVLDSRDQEFVKLEDEEKFIESYIFLLKIRFGENLKVDLDISPKAGNILPMVLQLLVENAVKHNEISSDRNLRVRIHRAGDRLVVVNNLQRKSTLEPSSNFGLHSILQRYESLGLPAVEIRETDNEFSVAIPIIHSDED